jgi:hypothetical protein
MIEPTFFIFPTLKYKRFQALRFAATFVCLLLFVVDLVSAQADYPLGGITLYVAPGGRTSLRMAFLFMAVLLATRPAYRNVTGK